MSNCKHSDTVNKVKVMKKVFDALAHPDRRAILEMLKAQGELNAGEIAEAFTFSKPTLSHHLKALCDAELLVRDRRGQFVYFQINQSIFEEVLGLMVDLFSVGSKKKTAATAATIEEV